MKSKPAVLPSLRNLLIYCTLLLEGLNPSSLTKAEPNDPWVDCLYNNKSIACRQTFLCPGAPCNRFRIDWIDGISGTYSRIKDGSARNVGFYQDAHGGEWDATRICWFIRSCEPDQSKHNYCRHDIEGMPTKFWSERSMQSLNQDRKKARRSGLVKLVNQTTCWQRDIRRIEFDSLHSQRRFRLAEARIECQRHHQPAQYWSDSL